MNEHINTLLLAWLSLWIEPGRSTINRAAPPFNRAAPPIEPGRSTNSTPQSHAHQGSDPA
jgi:hypothetical protein